MENVLQQQMIAEFGGENSQTFYVKKVEDGLWISEKHFIEKYFTKKGRVLDLGCGAGRTTIPLVEMGFDVVGVDVTPPMIESAKRVAREKELHIEYKVGDAEHLEFSDNTFDYAIFSNQGWSQIPGKEHRLQTLKEVRRALKDGGILIFTAHPRVFWYDWPFWAEQWVRFYILKRMQKLFDFKIKEVDFGDRFFASEPSDTQRTYTTEQYIHFPTIKEVRKEIQKSGFKLREANGKLQISAKDIRRHPPVIYICQK